MANIDRRTMMAIAAGGVAGTLAARALAVETKAAALEADAFDHLVVRHRIVKVNGLDIFYREAGHVDAPAVLLLHGFPASSHMFRHLLPALADNFRVVAPDYPGFGYSSFPPRGTFKYSFGALADVVREFTDQVGLKRYAIYIQDYGAPVGLRLALMRPDAIAAIISQNGNAYEEGLSNLWDPLKTYWRDPSPANRAVLEGWLGAEGTRLQYVAGVSGDQIERLSPDTWTLDWQKLGRAGNADAQIDLFADYQSNVALYPEFQRFFRERRPPALILWGKNDPFFTVAGAKGFLRDLPNAELDLVDTSHFVLETHGPYAAHRIREFLQRALS
jgi:pimeloyl-ACP methyl ester carboxylesterase